MTATSPVAETTFRAALRHYAEGVAVLTATGPGGPLGLTVTSLTPASLDPPLLSFYVDRASRTLPVLRDAERFAVHLLAADSCELAARFARRGADRFGPSTRWRAGPGDLPLLEDATVRLICDRRSVLPVGDHFLIVGEVTDAVIRDGGDPLLYAHGQFGRWVPLGPGEAGAPEELDGSDIDL